MEPLVSILIPAYNSEEWIADTLRSAIAQTWPNKEIIVVDDGSMDQTLMIARQFESDILRVVTQPNKGAASARNLAFSLSHGDYIQWLDADDLLAPDKITTQLDYAVTHDLSPRALLSSAWGHSNWRWQRAEFVPTALWCDLSPIEWLLRKMGEEHVFMQTATWLVSRELTEASGPWNTQLLSDDDGEYFCRVLLASQGVRFFPGSKVYYRRSGSSSLSHIGMSDRKMEALCLSMELHVGYLRSLEESERVRSACIQYLRNSVLVFYPQRLDLVQRCEQMAAGLGRRLEIPRLPWKYVWIEKTFGWDLAKRAQIVLPRFKWSLINFADKCFSYFDRASLTDG